MNLEPSARIGSWLLDHEIGRGGMGVVWAARREGSSEVRALKILHEHRAESDAVVRRFLREADAARRVRHPGIVAIHEIEHLDDHHVLVMDLVPGRSLDDHLRAVERDPAAAAELAGDPHVSSHRDRRYVLAVAELFAAAARALAALHDEGVIHRDLKPANLLLHADGHLVITDFGIARAVDAETMTITGDVLGTPLYLAPERIRAGGRDVDPRTDVYSLAVAMYQVLALKAPFEGETLPELVDDIERGAPRTLHDVCPWISPALSDVVDRAMSRRPADRHDGAQALAEDLEAYVAGRTVASRGPGRIERGRRVLTRNPALRRTVVTTLTLLVLVALALGWRSFDAMRQERMRRERVVEEARAAVERGAWGTAWRAALEAERLDPAAEEVLDLKEEIIERASAEASRAAARGGADLALAVGMTRMIGEFDPAGDSVQRLRADVGGAIREEVRRRAVEGSVDEVERLLGEDTGLELEQPEVERIAEALDGAAAEAAASFKFARAAAFMAMAARLKRSGDAPRPAGVREPAFTLLQDVVDGLVSDDPVDRDEALRILEETRSWALLPRRETERFLRSQLPELTARDLLRAIAVIETRRLFGAVPELLALDRSSSTVRLAVLRALDRMGDERAAPFLLEASAADGEEQVLAIRAMGRAGTREVVARLVHLVEPGDVETVLEAASSLMDLDGIPSVAARNRLRAVLGNIVATENQYSFSESLLTARVVIAQARIGFMDDARFPHFPWFGLFSSDPELRPAPTLRTCTEILKYAMEEVTVDEDIVKILDRDFGDDYVACCVAMALARARFVDDRARRRLGARMVPGAPELIESTTAGRYRVQAFARLLGAEAAKDITRLAEAVGRRAKLHEAPDFVDRLAALEAFRAHDFDLLLDPYGESWAVCRALAVLAPKAGWRQQDRVIAAREMLRVAADPRLPVRLRGAAWDALGAFTDSADLVAVSAAARAVNDAAELMAMNLAVTRLGIGTPGVRPRAVATPEDALRAACLAALGGRSDEAFAWIERALTMGLTDWQVVTAAPELAALDSERLEALRRRWR